VGLVRGRKYGDYQTNEIPIKGLGCAESTQHVQQAIPNLGIMANSARLLKQ
jgi:hypothetical protein